MLWDSIRRLVTEDAGMEMVEWSIVGVIFAVDICGLVAFGALGWL